VVREELTKKVTLKQKPEEGEGETHMTIEGKSTPSRRKSKYKGLEASTHHEREGKAQRFILVVKSWRARMLCSSCVTCLRTGHIVGMSRTTGH
jgi:hypothetical protein